MKWEHKCDINWMRTRQGYLTASDVRKLLPVTKTGRKRTVTDEDRLKILAGKFVNLTDDDCMSYGAAARGHILEPYAINEVNRIYNDDPHFYHWDDSVVIDPLDRTRRLAFSPDGMDIPYTGDVLYDDLSVCPHAIVEVKSYSPENHLATASLPLGSIEERWQIATAMAVMDTIDIGMLVLYNPKMDVYPLFIREFTRSSLSKEIDMVNEVERDWCNFIHGFHLGMMKLSPLGIMKPEWAIIAELEERRRLNP